MTKPNWTPIQIRLGDLIAWDINPRQSTKKDAEHLLETERKFGQPIPFCVSPFYENGKCDCYDGHQRLNSWVKVYGSDFVIWAFQSDRHLTEDERKDFVLQIHNAHGQWNADMLGSWPAETLKGGWFDNDTLKSWKADVTWLGEFLKSEAPAVDAEPQTDRAAELLEKWQVAPGDLWLIGEHRLICGDCTDAATVARVMDGEQAEATITDPPYGIGYEYDEYDDVQGNEYTDFCDKWFSLCLEVSPVVVITTGWAYKPYWYSKKPKGEMVWFDKTKQSGHSTAHLRKTEPVFVFGKVLNKWDWDIFEDEGVRNDGVRELHTCPKPVSLWQKFIEKQSNVNGIIYEPFSGSGTTLLACENEERRCRAIELDPKYVAVALERMSQAFPALPIRRAE